MAKEKHRSLLANPVAVELGLDEPNGPSVVLAQAIEAVGDSAGGREPNVLYPYLLDACEKVFANELDQATFEEHMRWFFRTQVCLSKISFMWNRVIVIWVWCLYQAYHLYTLDKVIMAIIKQVSGLAVLNHGDSESYYGMNL